MKKRKQWFEARTTTKYVLFWKHAGEIPGEAEIQHRLDDLEIDGAKRHPPFVICNTLSFENKKNNKFKEKH